MDALSFPGHGQTVPLLAHLKIMKSQMFDPMLMRESRHIRQSIVKFHCTFGKHLQLVSRAGIDGREPAGQVGAAGLFQLNKVLFVGWRPTLWSIVLKVIWR